MGDFCCGGCEQVHTLIHSQGLDTFYSLQDRLGRPVGELAAPHRDELRKLQASAESGVDRPSLKLRVDGMSCLGCIWLVERLARTQPGGRFAQVSLQENSLMLRWAKGTFDLASLAGQLGGFGYQLKAFAGQGRPLSPLAWRTLVCALLAGNVAFLSWLLLVLKDSGQGLGLVMLLISAFSGISFLVGLPHFLVPVQRSLRVGSLHYDLVACIGVGVLLLGLLVDYGSVPLWLPSTAIAGLLMARFVQSTFWQWLLQRSRSEFTFSEVGQARFQRVLVASNALFGLGVVVFWIQSLFALRGGIADTVSAACFAFSFFPIALASRYGVHPFWLSFGLGLGWLGVALAAIEFLSALAAIAWMFLCGLLWMLLFVVWQQQIDPANSAQE